MELLERRKIGILPEIDIAGHTYTVNLQLNELRNVENPSKKLSLDEMVISSDRQNYMFFYDCESRSILHASSDMLTLPKNVILVTIPDEMGLDPVGLARKYGLGDEYFLKMHPYEKAPKATLTSLEKSGLPEYVASNQNQRRNDSQVLKKPN